MCQNTCIVGNYVSFLRWMTKSWIAYQMSSGSKWFRFYFFLSVLLTAQQETHYLNCKHSLRDRNKIQNCLWFVSVSSVHVRLFIGSWLRRDDWSLRRFTHYSNNILIDCQWTIEVTADQHVRCVEITRSTTIEQNKTAWQPHERFCWCQKKTTNTQMKYAASSRVNHNQIREKKNKQWNCKGKVTPPAYTSHSWCEPNVLSTRSFDHGVHCQFNSINQNYSEC